MTLGTARAPRSLTGTRSRWESPLRRAGIIRRLAPLLVSGLVGSLLLPGPDIAHFPWWQDVLMLVALAFALSFASDAPPWCRLPMPTQALLLALASGALLAPYDVPSSQLEVRWLNLAITVAVIPAVTLVPWERLPRLFHVAIPYAGIIAIYFTRLSSDGTAAVLVYYYLTTLVLALYYPRGMVAGGMVLTLVSALAPTGAHLTSSQLTESWLLAYFNIPMAVGITQIVAHLQRQAGTLVDITDLLDSTAGATDTDGVRRALCATACRVTDADEALFFELTLDRHLLLRGAASISLGEIRLPVEAADDAAPPLAPLRIVEAFTSERRLHTPNLRYLLADATRPGEGMLVRSALVEPVTRDGRCFAVLVMLWARPSSVLPVGVTEATRFVAQYAGLVVQQADLTAQLDSFANTDPLTGAANRREWDAQIGHAITESLQKQEPLTLALIDVDDFKRFNDVHGHPAGDRLLQEVTQTWRSHLRDRDLLARLGGDEFGVLLHTDMETAQRIVERVVGLLDPDHTCSVGLADPVAEDTPASLMRRADDELYRVKRQHHSRHAGGEGR